MKCGLGCQTRAPAQRRQLKKLMLRIAQQRQKPQHQKLLMLWPLERLLRLQQQLVQQSA
jgi:hypothetical protein